MTPSSTSLRYAAVLLPIVVAACTRSTAAPVSASAGTSAVTLASRDVEQAVGRGRQLVLTHDCGACHRGGPNPAAPGYLSGMRDSTDIAQIGPFKTRPRNLTPDIATGIGRFTERQIFNALRYGLKPSATPDVAITSSTPGVGNFPAKPQYLAPPMPWPSWRHMSDQELSDIATYLKRGVKPVVNKVEDSEGPPDFWASGYTVEKIGTHPAPAFPAAAEVDPGTGRERLLRGRKLVLDHACGACHGAWTPGDTTWLVGMHRPDQEFTIGPFKTRPRNLTPDNVTGLGRFTERQIFNALRYGLRPGETPDVDITSVVPGQGNFPVAPKYLAPPMPWIAWRHLADDQLRDIAFYLKNGVKPVRHKVADSEGPPDFWASAYTPDKIGPYPAVPFPTANEKRP